MLDSCAAVIFSRSTYEPQLASALRIAALSVEVAITSQSPFAVMREILTTKPELLAAVQLDKLALGMIASALAFFRLFFAISPNS